MKCPKCGAELKEGASFCGECGTKISSNDEITINVDDVTEKIKDAGSAAASAAKFAGEKGKEAASKIGKKTSFLWGNPGRSIKGLAKVLFWIVVVPSIIYCIVIIFQGFKNLKYGSVGWGMIGLGIIGIPLSVLLAWLLNIGLYSWGSTVENIKSINEKIH